MQTALCRLNTCEIQGAYWASVVYCIFYYYLLISSNILQWEKYCDDEKQRLQLIKHMGFFPRADKWPEKCQGLPELEKSCPVPPDFSSWRSLSKGVVTVVDKGRNCIFFKKLNWFYLLKWNDSLNCSFRWKITLQTYLSLTPYLSLQF